MRKLLALAGLAITLSASGVTQAELKGDPAAGREMAQTCAACHGAEGISAVGIFPNLAGQQASYLTKQILDIRDGKRVVPQMAGQVDNFSDQDAADVAAYFASKAPNLGQVDAAAEVIARGQELYRAGDMAKGIPACSACHSPTGQGIGTAAYPALSGQKTDYIVSTLQAFAAGERDNDPNAIMRTIAGKMSDDDMQAVSQYVLGLY
ncbi:Cytochrome c553 [Onishia taeanensis]|jgi:cytochrome c553|uniref:Cytochrome c553 n=1 Tax=Onishia taeanensis TaxID=284577 RepID=A0A1G7T8M2_9GAMM|nr:c-type cytochrome [Halomonas taeanensis]SDG31663.1 Cytochrome c553 [Halomonas taeanensis]